MSRAGGLWKRRPTKWVGWHEGDWASWVGFKEKVPSGIDLQFPMDFEIWQDFENFYKEIL
jgi:hypothetical protein